MFDSILGNLFGNKTETKKAVSGNVLNRIKRRKLNEISIWHHQGWKAKGYIFYNHFSISYCGLFYCKFFYL